MLQQDNDNKQSQNHLKRLCVAFVYWKSISVFLVTSGKGLIWQKERAKIGPQCRGKKKKGMTLQQSVGHFWCLDHFPYQ